jgi:2Fe-2S ferredoxin
MVKITYIEAHGTEHTVDAKLGQTVMEGAVKNSVPGIDAICGGSCACGTCRVYVDAAWGEKTGVISSMEQSMIEYSGDTNDRVRLSCQIRVTEDLNGLIVRMPVKQQ